LTIFLLLGSLLPFGCSKSEKSDNTVEINAPISEISIIPEPASVVHADGYFIFDRDTKIIAADEFGIRASYALNTLLMEKYGFTLEVTDDTSLQNSIIFSSIVNPENEPSEEAYLLKIEPSYIHIKGNQQGIFYGIQSLIQLLPLDFKGVTKIPAAAISDAPRFRYRGMHLDVARHFMPAEFVKKFIRLISKYKYNYFHWHLTDDQGWRIQINKYPRLTEVGSKRRETVVGKSYRPFIGDNKPVKGYYTQGEIRDIVAYAKARNITIIPEIDMPGHSSSALASYPELGCKENYPYKVQTTWGAFPEIYCPKETTFQFIEDVLSEVIDLFPDSQYIHIGGDEVMMDSWKDSKYVQELKRINGLSSEKDVQNWFIRRIESFVNSKGKKIIVWDDVLDNGLPLKGTIMSWRGFEGGIKAARAKREVIMTPSDFTYFDHPQADSKFEPLSLGKPVALEKVYKFEPIPNELKTEDAQYIIGAQGCIWTEFLKTPEDVEYMMFPRVIALAEVLWSKRKNKDFNDFSKRLYKEFPKLDEENVNYRIPEPYGFGNRNLSLREEALIDLSTPIPNGRIYYTVDGTIPNERSNLYTSPFTINLDRNEGINLKTRVISSEGRASSIFNAKYKRGSK
jgi:hexosaminidase